MAITEDASTPATAVNTVSGTLASITTASFTPPAGTLLVALCTAGWASQAAAQTTIAISDSVSGAWTTAAYAQGATVTNSAGGAAQCAWRYLSSAPGAMTVTGTYTGNNGGGVLSVRVLNGCDPLQIGAANGTTLDVGNTVTAHTVTLTTTQVGSVVYGAFDDANRNDTITAGTNVTIITNDNDTTNLVGMTIVTSSAATTTPGSTSYVVNTNVGADSNFAAMEVTPTGGTPVGRIFGTVW